MLGLIYGHLPTKEDRRNFAHSCKAVHSAPDVLHRITSLNLHLADVTPADAVAAVAHFPAGAVLKRLVLRAGSSEGKEEEVEDVLLTLRAFDEAAGSDARVPARLQEVETLRMEVCVWLSTRKASSGGGRGACYTLAAVRVDEFGSKEAKFEVAFSPLCPLCCTHNCLCVYKVRTPYSACVHTGAHTTSPAFLFLHTNTGHQD